MLSNHPNCLGGNGPSASSDLIGDVDGPASATDNAVARFDGTTGKLIQNSVVTIADTTGDIAGASSLTSPAASPLTLGTGTSGAAITVLSASNKVGIGTVSPLARLSVQLSGTSPAGYTSATNSGITLDCGTNDNGVINLVGGGELGIYRSNSSNAYDVGITFGTNADRSIIFTAANSDRAKITSTGNLLIGTTSETGLTGAGGLKINSSTAGSAGAGALVVTGGLSAGAASYFGGAVNVAGVLYGAGTNTWALQSVGASGALVAGGWLYGINNGFNITPNGAGVAGATLMLAAFDGTGYREMLSTANVASGASTLRLAGYGGPTTVGGTLGVAGTATFSRDNSTGLAAISLPNDESSIVGPSANTFIKMGGNLNLSANSQWAALTAGVNRLTITSAGAATFSGTVSPQQATTAAAPAYVKGAIYFDTTLNKLRVGGATAWETITSV